MLAAEYARGPRMAEAWAVRRKNFPDQVTFAVPGMIRYESARFANRVESFVAVSVTGSDCALDCAHCRRKLLAGMRDARQPEDLVALGRAVRARGATGILVSGGCDGAGRVPLDAHLGAIAQLKALGLTVVVHAGLLGSAAARRLKSAGVDQVLFDVVGDADTVRTVYGLASGPEDYAESLLALREAGLAAAPHVVVGLHFGQIRGEYRALEIIRDTGAERIVLVALKALPGTPMADVSPVPVEALADLAATARVENPTAPISFGCARPYGPRKAELEQALVAAGVNALAFPEEATVRYAERRGLAHRFVERCCSLV